MEVEALGGGLRLIRPPRFSDARGWLCELHGGPEWDAAGLSDNFVQDNASRTDMPGVVRGLHAQRPPHTQAKLFRVIRGEVFNVTVDLRPASFGRIDARRLGDETWIYVPKGFVHGFQTLQAQTDVHYKLSAGFSAEHLVSLDWSDPALNLAWPLEPRADLRSARDRTALPLAALRDVFQ